MKIPVVIRFFQNKYYIVHARSYQNAFRREVNGYDTREEAVIFATNNGCAVIHHSSDRLQETNITPL